MTLLELQKLYSMPLQGLGRILFDCVQLKDVQLKIYV